MTDQFPKPAMVNLNSLGASKELNTSLVDAEIKTKAGWIAYCLKNEYKKWIEIYKREEEISAYHR